MTRLNLGCGRDYRDGWVNVDANRSVRADVYTDFSGPLPFANNTADELLLDNVIEHVPRPRFFPFMDELHRVCAPGATIRIYAPHFSGIFALKHPGHDLYFGAGTFALFEPEAPFNGERYGKARFYVRSERLLFFHHNLVNYPWLSKLPVNALFNLNDACRVFMERFQFLGFDEIYYELEAVK